MKRCFGCMETYEDSFEICPYCGYDNRSLPLSKNQLFPGTVLDNRYTVGKVLGQGGFGITYIAWDQWLDKPVAIKEYFPTAFVTRVTGQKEISCINEELQKYYDSGLQKMLSESRILAQFTDQPNIVQVLDCIEENGTAYIIMELLRGRTLQQYLNAEGPMSPEHTLQIILPVLQALETVHKTGLIHRDISPDNLFVCQDGSVKLLDFGAARIANDMDNKTLSVMLKKGYAPIEQYSSHGKQGPYTDVYAVCATMYKMLTGKTPESSLDRMSDDSLRPISDYTTIPESVEKIIRKGMAVEAADRIQSAKELYDALNGAFKKEQDKPVTPVEEQEDIPKKVWLSKRVWKRTCIALVSMILIVAIASGVLFGIQRFKITQTAEIIQDTDLSAEAIPQVSQDMSIGDTVLFGEYGIDGEQAQPIEWMVLDSSGDEYLLLSKVGLDYKECHDEGMSFTWETCWIRDWLNTDFYDEAFSDEEKKRILLHENENPDDTDFGNVGGNNTLDRCFLLSRQEVEEYFPEPEQRQAQCTDSLFKREFSDQDLDGNNIWWMLRSPGVNSSIADENMCYTEITPDGNFDFYSYAGNSYSVIRPAVWVDVQQNCAHDTEEWVSGYREHLYDFSYEYENGVLTLSGNGVMPYVADEWDEDIKQNAEKIVIDKGITTISNFAFMDFVNLTSIQIPDSVEEIGDGAFRNCENLKTLSLPSSIKRIGAAIYYKSGLVSNKDYWKNGLFCINHCLLRAKTTLTGKVVVPNSISVIAESAFYECPVSEVVIPNGVTRLETYLFGYCTELEKVDLPDSIRWIGTNSFWYCESLNNIRLPGQLQYVEQSGFYACDSLTEIVLPENLKFLGEQAFSCCFSLESVTMYKGVEIIQSGAFFNTSLETVHFYGTKSDWEKIKIESDNDDLLQAEKKWETPPKSPFAEAKPGAAVKFGTYEQDGDEANGKEEIEWLVIKASDDGKSLLLLSRYALDCRQFNEEYISVTWEECDMRSWLNDTFYKAGFDKEEKAYIRSTKLNNPDNEEYDTSGGAKTTDYLFLLSLDEARALDAKHLKVKPTAYAIGNGAFENEETGTTWWALRSPGAGNDLCAIVRSDGDIRAGGEVVNASGAVRPAMWVQTKVN